MRRTSTFITYKHIMPALLVLVLILAGCSLEKKSALNRGLQNLTAYYNILFNAREILREKQEAYAASFVDDYTEILSVYKDTVSKGAEPDKDLEAAKIKANNIISIKEQSRFLGDAYLVLGKANFLDANYFNAVEYFNYVILTATAKQADLKQEARVWKARSLIYLNNYREAKLELDTAIININPKKDITGDVYATKLQYDINTQDYTDGEEMAAQAVKHSDEKLEQLRWTFILGQLQELNGKPAEAVASYNRVAKSNVSFDMAFNSNLNRIRVEDNQNGVKISRITRLRSLLRDENNKEFTDQIYYQIGQLQVSESAFDEAIKSYKLSTKNSLTNQNQKGLSYLRLADIYFKNKGDYAQARNYYDSTLASLSPNYPGYLTIQKKADNLQLLGDRLQTIAREDTLQMLAALDETARNKKIDEMVNRQIIQDQTASTPMNPTGGATGNAPDPLNDNTSPQASTPTGSKFYFYNSNAISQGFSSFKRVWGNRKLEDNWRRANRSNADVATNTSPLNAPKNIDPDAVEDPLLKTPEKVNAGNYRQDLLQNLPLTPPLLAQSNQRRYDAYLDIANFYRDVLDDKNEAAAAYEQILRLFPGNGNKAAIYYNLYRLYNPANAAASDRYKNLVLKEFPETPFAKTILDPDFGKRLNDEDTGFSSLYNQVYELYAGRQYGRVITSVDELLKQYPNNRYAAQMAYLKAFAAGHQERLDPFKAELQQIATKYPEDKLITPLINQHLTYIGVNQAELAARPVVITDKDTLDGQFTIPIVYQQQTEYRRPYTGGPNVITPDVRKPEKKPEPAPVIAATPVKEPLKQPEPVTPVATPEPVKQEPAQQPVVVQEPVKEPVVAQQPVQEQIKTTEPLLQQPVQTAPTVIAEPVKKAPSIFSMRDSTNYYFVVNVNSGTTNVASSRFGIGQFNRVNYQRAAINHNLKPAGSENQLIYVGRFGNLADVKDYARAIVPLLPDIMKVGQAKYSFFIITKENLDKLANLKTIESYVDFYQQNF